MQIDKQQALHQLVEAYAGDMAALEKDLHAVKLARKKISQSKNLSQHNGQPVVTMRQVTKTYKRGKHEVAALDGINLDIYEGELVALVGPSGSGKSTVLNMMSGLDTPTSGTVNVNGNDIVAMNNNQRAKFRSTNVGFVFQFFYLQPFLNLQTNVEVPAMFAGISRSERATRSAELIGAVGLEDRMTHRPKELSGGQMQRAAIARALLNRPKILLADEPTGNLDTTNAKEVVALFQQVRDTYGTTVVIVTHDTKIAELADRVIEMSDGKVVE